MELNNKIVQSKDTKCEAYAPFTKAECADLTMPFFHVGQGSVRAVLREEQPFLSEDLDSLDNEYLEGPYVHMFRETVVAIYQMFRKKYGVLPVVDKDELDQAFRQFFVDKRDKGLRMDHPEWPLIHCLNLRITQYMGYEGEDYSVNEKAVIKNYYVFHMLYLLTIVFALRNAVNAKASTLGFTLEPQPEDEHTPEEFTTRNQETAPLVADTSSSMDGKFNQEQSANDSYDA